jgi:hypothetical protein
VSNEFSPQNNGLISSPVMLETSPLDQQFI